MQPVRILKWELQNWLMMLRCIHHLFHRRIQNRAAVLKCPILYSFIGVVYKRGCNGPVVIQCPADVEQEGGRTTLKFYYYRKQGIDNAISIHWLYGPCIKVSADEETLQ